MSIIYQRQKEYTGPVSTCLRIFKFVRYNLILVYDASGQKMDDSTTAAQDNDVRRLCQLLEIRKGAHHVASEGQISSDSLQKACQIAARNNHSAALEERRHRDWTRCELWATPRPLHKTDRLPNLATISAASYSDSIKIFRLLIACDWDVNEPLGHPGDALLYKTRSIQTCSTLITDAQTSIAWLLVPIT